MAEEEKTIVHILVEGRAVCGFGLPGVPGDWPAGHKWVALSDAEHASEANCPGCIGPMLNASIPDEIYTQATAGKYDGEASALLEIAGAEAALVIIKQGRLGDGFSIAINTRKVTAKAILAGVPRVLRDVADAIEREERERAKDLQ